MERARQRGQRIGRFRWLPNPFGLHPSGTAYPRWRTLRPAGGSGIGNGLQHPETAPVFPGKHGSTDKIARQLTLTFSLDNNTIWCSLQKGTRFLSEWVALNPACSQRITFQSAGSFVAASVRTRFGHE